MSISTVLGSRRTAFIWLVAARTATLQIQPFSKGLLDQKNAVCS
jgi:hypothetical protein